MSSQRRSSDLQHDEYRILHEADLPKAHVEVLGRSSSERIGRMVTDVVVQTLEGGLTEIRMSNRILDATVGLRSFLFDAVYENELATSEFKKATGMTPMLFLAQIEEW